MTPLDRVEALYRELVAHYGAGEDRELRVAAKFLLVAILKIKEHGGAEWETVLNEYVRIATHRPDKFERIVESNRAVKSPPSDNTLQ